MRVRPLILVLAGLAVGCTGSHGTTGGTGSGTTSSSSSSGTTTSTTTAGNGSTTTTTTTTSTNGGTTGGIDGGPIGPTNCVNPPTADGGLIGAFVAGNTQFAFNLLGQLSNDGGAGNVFLAPYSVSSAFAMLYPGAVNQNLTEIQQVLQFPADPITLGPAVGALDCMLTTDGIGEDGGRLDIANGLFVDDQFALKQPFLDEAQADFGAKVDHVDFANHPDVATTTINDWVSYQTQGLIPQLIQPGQITPDIVLVLVNALYFGGEWPTKFPTASDGTFYAGGTAAKTVPTMSDQTHWAGFSDQGTYKVLELQTSGSQIAVDFLLPNASDGLPELVAALTPAAFQSAVDAATPTTVDVQLPKLHLDFGKDLKPTLQTLGMQAPFNLSSNFSNLGDGDLGIFFVQHEAVLDLDEGGVHAAGSTAIGVGATGGATGIGVTSVFHADHPFLIAIRDVPTGTILFLGQVVDASQH
ncbi:MAG: serpin family protein [Deltaproteobacteria bacterium]|nr:serpin family protein [Deltaproteobacteria bacterium]